MFLMHNKTFKIEIFGLGVVTAQQKFFTWHRYLVYER